MTRPSIRCPICGDDSVFALWVDKVPPDACPLRAATVTACEFQMEKARQRALFRKLVPDAFDENGKILPRQLGRVLERVHQVEPGIELLIGGGIPEKMYRRAGIQL